MLANRSRSRGFWSIPLFLLIVVVAACSSNAPSSKPQVLQSPTSVPSSTITGPNNPGLKQCQPSSPIDNSSLGPEAHGTGVHAELWALLMPTSGIPPVAKTDVKIVWRMTGKGDFNIVAIGPHGTKVSPTQGPTEHGGSNWNRPGDEWGSVFNFPVAGCWDLHATRDNAFGDVWLKVVD